MFVIGPDKKVKLILVYPMTTGRNFDEVLRVIDSLQLTAKHKVATPVNWQQGDDVIIAGSVSDEQAKEIFGDWEAAQALHPHRPPAACLKERASGKEGPIMFPGLNGLVHNRGLIADPARFAKEAGAALRSFTFAARSSPPWRAGCRTSDVRAAVPESTNLIAILRARPFDMDVARRGSRGARPPAQAHACHLPQLPSFLGPCLPLRRVAVRRPDR